MPFHPIALAAKAELLFHHTITLQSIVNVLHVGCTATPPQSEIDGLAAAIDTWVGGHLNIWGNQVHYDGTRVTGQNTVSDPQAVNGTNAGVGTGGNNAPAGVCTLVKLTTATRSRSGRGRIFISASPQSDLISDGTQWDPAYLTVVQNGIIALATALIALTPASDLVVGSKKTGTAHNVTTVSAEGPPAYQRRRGGR
jgi:hypothetical protein